MPTDLFTDLFNDDSLPILKVELYRKGNRTDETEIGLSAAGVLPQGILGGAALSALHSAGYEEGTGRKAKLGRGTLKN